MLFSIVDSYRKSVTRSRYRPSIGTILSHYRGGEATWSKLRSKRCLPASSITRAIGGGAIILPGVTIADDAIIGAGSVVTRDVPRGATALGNPARVRA